jgi:hypothetical protein
MAWWLAQRTLEVVLGLMLWVGVPLGLLLIGVGGIILLQGDPDVIPDLVAIGVGLVLTPFCAITGWRLVTGRKGPGGGLFNPAILDHAEAAGALFHAARTSLWFGPDMARRESEGAAAALGRARRHWRKRAKRHHDRQPEARRADRP